MYDGVRKVTADFECRDCMFADLPLRKTRLSENGPLKPVCATPSRVLHRLGVAIGGDTLSAGAAIAAPLRNADIGTATNTKCCPNSDDVHYCYRPVLW